MYKIQHLKLSARRVVHSKRKERRGPWIPKRCSSVVEKYRRTRINVLFLELRLHYSNQRICDTNVAMKTFGEIVSEARRAKGLSQKELASKIRKEDGQPISPQYLNDVEHNRRNPPSEHLIIQIAALLGLDKDVLCLAAGTIPQDLKKIAASDPEKVEQAFKAFRKAVKKT
jgi:transcriptional regulator with XRE-family HTH domain